MGNADEPPKCQFTFLRKEKTLKKKSEFNTQIVRRK